MENSIKMETYRFQTVISGSNYVNDEALFTESSPEMETWISKKSTFISGDVS